MINLTDSVDFIVERALATNGAMGILQAPPHNWVWPSIPPESFAQELAALEDLLLALLRAENGTSAAAFAWDAAAGALAADVSFGLRLARLQFKSQPAKLSLFQGLRLNNTGRESRHQQALDFEVSWRKADAAWEFKPGLTLAGFKARREALRVFEETHMVAVKEETYTRAVAHLAAEALNQASMDWYEAATATFAADTPPGHLVRRLPTTYDPNRPPGPLVFGEHASPEAGRVELSWRAPRGVEYIIEALPPDATAWTVLRVGVRETSWTGEGLADGHWTFRGRARNLHGEGAMSAVIEVAVALARAG